MRTFWWSPPVVLTAAVVLALTGWACSSGATDMAPDTDAPAPATDVGQPDSAEVSGQAPRPKEGSPSVIILEPHIPSDVPVPDEPYPHANEAAAIKRVVILMRVLRWLPALLLAGLAAGLWPGPAG